MLSTAAYHGRFFWEGPAARSDQQKWANASGHHQQDCSSLFSGIISISNFIVYPVGQTRAGWKDAGAEFRK